MPLRRKLFDKMEDLKWFHSDLYSSMAGSSSQGSYSSNCKFNELTSSLAGLTIDIQGMVKELFVSGRRDTDSIRQDFIRNGIDSEVVTQIHVSRQPPPGFGISRWPLASLDNKPLTARHSLFQDKGNLEAGTLRTLEAKSARRKRSPKENEDYCVFCFNNREEQETYLGHSCRDGEGAVVCPKLRRYVCPYCQATGDMAHTKKYCPKKPIITPDDLQTMASPFVGRNASHRNRSNRGKRSLRF